MSVDTATATRSGDWIQTFTGRRFWPLDPRLEDVCIEDIAGALSRLCRYTGHTRTFYSVGEHSVRASHLVPAADALWALLHDASEAYLCDLPRPLKQLPEFVHYREAERRLMACICQRFGLPPEEPASVKLADRLLLATEYRDLMAQKHREAWVKWGKPLKETIEPWTPLMAKMRFLWRFQELT